jgi:hypothetical protein
MDFRFYRDVAMATLWAELLVHKNYLLLPKDKLQPVLLTKVKTIIEVIASK